MLKSSRLRRLLAVLVTLTAGVAASIVTIIAVAPAGNAEDCLQYVEVSPGKWEYVNVCDDDGGGGGGDEGGGDGGGNEEPQCYLGRQQIFDYDSAYCKGDLSCYVYAPPPTKEDPSEWPEPPSGTPEDAVYGEEWCFSQPPEEDVITGPVPVWDDDPPPVNWLDQAYQALGQIVVPDFTLTFDPPTRTYINTDTTFWAEGATKDDLTGTSALGLVAIATPDRFEVDPGDGSGAKTCPVAVAKADACTYMYTHASVDGPSTVDGQPAYVGQARLVYTVRFELNGAPWPVANAPAELPGEWEASDVSVNEIQVIVE
ncbi:MAG TPA: hypothetical protein VIP77_02505 [Jiangellaceae bacterium]